MSMTERDLDRFLSKIDFVGECWDWTGAGHPKGYGMIWLSGSMVWAHRVACWLRHGPPPEDKPTTDHLCKNRGCVNPEHLRWASMKEQSSGECRDNASIKVGDDIAIECIKRYLSGESQRKIARDFEVNQTTISDWITGRSRAHLLERAKEELSGSN